MELLQRRLALAAVDAAAAQTVHRSRPSCCGAVPVPLRPARRLVSGVRSSDQCKRRIAQRAPRRCLPGRACRRRCSAVSCQMRSQAWRSSRPSDRRAHDRRVPHAHGQCRRRAPSAAAMSASVGSSSISALKAMSSFASARCASSAAQIAVDIRQWLGRLHGLSRDDDQCPAQRLRRPPSG